ncbi:MAG: hypothetical protein Q7U75_10550 [Desulfobacterales bacterium]|nr:hypothetical protein [Desulfobacterales bacterium]
MENPYEYELPYACLCGAVLESKPGSLTLVAADGTAGTGYVDSSGDLVTEVPLGFPGGTPAVSCAACGLRLN